jgi:SAM-dependent methyltransferase
MSGNREGGRKSGVATRPGAGVGDPESQVRRVRDEYSRIAERGGVCSAAGCCSASGSRLSESIGYKRDDVESLPPAADMGLGCGAPVGLLDLRPGETVLDLGAGGGIDALLAAREVGAAGRVIGVDMTPRMIELARRNARESGCGNVEFREGRLEALPVDDASVDAVTSNCVINLVPDKRAVFAEVARVLRPGGRLVVSDIVLERPLPGTLLEEMDAGNCIVTAVSREEYFAAVREAGLVEPEILGDVDYLEAVGWTDESSMNEESRALLERARIRFDEIRGAVRSITLRARKPLDRRG